MVATLLKILLVWIVVYTVIAEGISRYFSIGERNNVTGPILSMRSDIGLNLVGKLSRKYERFWGYWGKIGVISAVITAISAFVLITFSVYRIFFEPSAISIQGPTDMIVIPGVNRFLPISAAPEIILALLIAMVVHEGGHAIYCKLGDIRIKSTGVILGALIPIGAFVEPDEEEQFDASTMDQLKMYSAGIMNNYAVFGICIIVMFTLIPILISPVTGIGVANVFDNSPAENSELTRGDVIVEANNVPIANESELDTYIKNNPSQGIENITTKDGDKIDLQDGVFLRGAPNVSQLSPGSTITQYNGESVNTTAQLNSFIMNEENRTANITYNSGNTETLVIGAYATVGDNTQFSESLNIDQRDTIIIHSLNGRSVQDGDILKNVTENITEDEINITYYIDGEFRQEQIPAQNFDVDSLILSSNPSGIQTTDIGVGVYPKDRFVSILSFDGFIGTLQNIVLSLLMPIGSLADAVDYNFPGFTPDVQNFYTVSIASGIFTNIIFFFFSVLYWSSWLNFNLALFNCFPTFALDGGFILKATVEAVPKNISDTGEKYLIIGLKAIILVPLLLLMFGPLII